LNEQKVGNYNFSLKANQISRKLIFVKLCHRSGLTENGTVNRIKVENSS